MHLGYITTEYITDGRYAGGLANYLQKVGQAFSGKGYPVSIFCLSSIDRHWKDGLLDVYEIKRSRLRVPGFQALNGWLIVLDRLISAKRIEKRVWEIHARKPIDIIQTSSFNTPGYTLLNNGRIPIVCRISSYSPIIRSAFGGPYTLAHRVLDRMEVRQVINADASFAPSHFIASVFSRMERYFPIVLPSPLDTGSVKEDFSLYDSILKGKRYFLYFSWLNAVKGVDLVAKSISTILGQYPDVYFVFIGGNHYLPNYRQFGIDLVYLYNSQYINRIIYREPVSKPLLYGILANALGVLLPSRVDNLPNACLEAFQYEIPVVASNQSSLEEMVDDGKTGILFMNGNVNSLIDGMERLLKMTECDMQAMKKNIRAKVRQIYSEDRTGQLLSLYESVRNGFNT